ncbi:hypothetical protein ATCC90586_002317 [Pythium insidiosum]|nr:hypothetical protein ATCC90586_002317 [Pythium insidiosum]
MNNYVSDVEQLVRSKLKMDLREPDIEDARSSCPVHDEDGRLRMKMRCNMSVQQLQPEALKLDLVRLQQHFHLISAEVKREPGTGKKLRGTGEKSNKDKVERMGAAPALAGGKQTEYCESITVDLRISTAAGQLHLYNVRCLVLEHNDDEVRLGRETLRDIGIDVENSIDQLAGPDRVATADHDDSEDDNVGVAEKPVADVATLLERMLDDAAVYSVEIDIDVAEGLSESLFVDAPIQVEYTTVQWEPEIEWIEATEFKENLRKGDYSEVFHLNVLKDDGSVIDNVAVRRLVDKFGDMLSLVLPLSNLTRGETAWQWTAVEEIAFNAIRAKQLAAPVPRLPDT